ncbi:MAG: NAD-dependent epimerase/dehydratase family protein [Chloroflexi bacterium]|nr:NAD-dependent epimerase/dehydratase family protein [Chloroflexota bacterium]
MAGGRILVTGGAGFIGSHTVDLLVARGYDVRVLDSLEPPVHPADARGRPPAYLPDVEFLGGSVLNRDLLRHALEGVDAVFHFAAYQDYLTDFSRFFSVNAAGTALLYELIVNERLPIRKVVVASSQIVYGEGRHRCPRDGVQYPGQRLESQLARQDWEVHCSVCQTPTEPGWTDESVVNPHNSYAIAKRAQEEIAIKLGQRYGIPSVALRYSIVQGPRQSFRNAYSGALRSFAVRALAGRPPLVYEDGAQLRDYVSVHDIARANVLVLEDPRADYRVFNVGGARAISVRQLARLVIEASGNDLEPEVPGLYRVGDMRHILSDVASLRALGWEPTRGQAEIVREYVAWAREQPDLRDTYSEAAARMRAMGVLRESVAVGANGSANRGS